jgi:RimJ/RimL family protein N-acetyltransferase
MHLDSVCRKNGLGCDNTFKEQTDIRWGIELKENNKLIGDCGFGHIDEPKRPTELGYILAAFTPPSGRRISDTSHNKAVGARVLRECHPVLYL